MSTRTTSEPVAKISIPEPPATPGLTGKRAAFVLEYLQDLNATAAYLRAGYKNTPAANKHAYRLLQDPAVRSAIAAYEAKIAAHALSTIEQLELELERIGLADIRKLFRPDGSLKRPDEWDDDTAAAVESLVVEEQVSGEGENRKVTGCIKKITLRSAVTALIHLLRRRDLATKGPPQDQAPAPIKVLEHFDQAEMETALAEIRAILGHQLTEEPNTAPAALLPPAPARDVARPAQHQPCVASPAAPVRPFTPNASPPEGRGEHERPARRGSMGQAAKLPAPPAAGVIPPVSNQQQRQQPTVSPPSVARPARAAAATGGIYLKLGGECRGPFTEADVRARLEKRHVGPGTFGRREGSEEWLPLRTLLGLPDR